MVQGVIIWQPELVVQVLMIWQSKIGGLDSTNPVIRLDGLKCDDLVTKIGGLDFDDPTIKIGQPPSFAEGVKVWRWRICAKLVEQMV